MLSEELLEPEELPEFEEPPEPAEGADASPPHPTSYPDAATTAAPFIKSRREILNLIILTSCTISVSLQRSKISLEYWFQYNNIIL